MSALPPIADIRQRIEHVCFVPITDISEATGVIENGFSVHAFLISDRRGSLHVKIIRSDGLCIV
jgi:hypothetical protein